MSEYGKIVDRHTVEFERIVQVQLNAYGATLLSGDFSQPGWAMAISRAWSPRLS